ncbi:MAG: hypothetical protein KGL35_03285 [Bradyrhizobium sp.]|nr:hypothetical protein [Bradyrhizobium sp.]
MAALLPATTITAAVTAAVGATLQLRDGAPHALLIQANFTYGSGGTSATAYVQTSVDGGLTWCDIANFAFTTASGRKLFNLSCLTPVTTQATPTDGALTANTAVDGVLGRHFRVKYTTVGTYAGGTTLEVDVSTSRTAPAS